MLTINVQYGTMWEYSHVKTAYYIMNEQSTEHNCGLDHLKDTLLRDVNYVQISSLNNVYYLEFTVNDELSTRMKLLGIQPIECIKELSLLLLSHMDTLDIFKFDRGFIVPFNIVYTILIEPDDNINVDIYYPGYSFPNACNNEGNNELLTFLKFVVDNDSHSYKKVLEFWKKYHQLYIQKIDNNIKKLEQ